MKTWHEKIINESTCIAEVMNLSANKLSRTTVEMSIYTSRYVHVLRIQRSTNR